MKRSTPLSKLLSTASGDFSRTLRRAGQLRHADLALQQLLGTACAGHCRVANIRGTTLVLQTDSAAWAARLRYQLPAIQRQLKASTTFSAIRSIEVTIRPRQADRQSVQAQKLRPARLSGQAARLIAAVADTTEDPALRSALQRLASRGSGD